MGNVKARLKMEAAAEKAKKTLSPNGVTEVNVSVECLANDRNLTCVITKDEFEARSSHLVSRLIAPIERCLSEVKLSKEQISEVEIVGGSSRVNTVKRTIGQALGRDPSLLNYGLKTTMNSDEAVARGAALQCAMLSSCVKVKPFNIIDKLPYDVVVRYDISGGGSVEGKDGEDEEGAGEDVMDTQKVTATVGPRKCYCLSAGQMFHILQRKWRFKQEQSVFCVTGLRRQLVVPSSPWCGPSHLHSSYQGP